MKGEAGEPLEYVFLSGVPSQPRAESAARSVRDETGLDASERGRSGMIWTPDYRREAHQSAGELLRLSSLGLRMSLNNDTPKPTSNELIQISVPLTQKAGKKYWRGLDELADTKEFREWVTKEFPGGVDMLEGSSRRNVLKIMAASFGMAGLAACRRPMEHVLPASRGIEDFVPGQAYFYSSVFQHAGEAMGILVETHDGRPTKIEGNPQHPYSLGSSTVHAQASLLSMYDPGPRPEGREG